MDKIGPFIVERLCSHPEIMVEFSQMVATPVSSIESTVLPKALPKVFEARDLRVLEKLSEDMSSSPSKLLVEYSHNILAHVLLLPEESTASVFDFMLQIIRVGSGSQTDKIDIPSLIRSCVIQLLSELVIVLGEENRKLASSVSEF
jgi:serine/threonine-protein kinase ATR